MNAEIDDEVATIAAAIGERARARILFSLLDGHARSSTELAVVAEVSPSTASVHLSRLTQAKLVHVSVQGKRRYYSLAGRSVAKVLEALSVVAGGGVTRRAVSRVPDRLRNARVCYDHLAGVAGVQLHDRMLELGWFKFDRNRGEYGLTPKGEAEIIELGIDVEEARSARRRIACPCPDWSERKPHLAGALGAALLQTALKRKWFTRDLDSRALSITTRGRSELHSRLGISLPA